MLLRYLKKIFYNSVAELRKYNFYVSRNGKEWMKCDTTGEFSNIMHNPVPYFVRFGKIYPARYFKLEPVAEINSKAATAVGEVGVLLK